MFTVIIAEKEHIDRSREYDIFLSPFADHRHIALCRWYPEKDTLAEAVPELRETGARIEELTLKIKHVAAYRQLKPIYDRYHASKDKEKFLRGDEREIILFEAAARECKRLGAVPLPSAARMQAEMDALTARRAALTAERQKARREEQDYAAVRRNVEEFLSPPRQVPARQKDMELK